MKVVAVIFLLIFCALNGRLWQGSGSLAELRHLNAQVEQQRQENLALEKRNAQMRMDVLDLKSGTDGVEERARHELGMIKKGEVFYRIVRQQ